jgi:hypothetical protein
VSSSYRMSRVKELPKAHRPTTSLRIPHVFTVTCGIRLLIPHFSPFSSVRGADVRVHRGPPSNLKQPAHMRSRFPPLIAKDRHPEGVELAAC